MQPALSNRHHPAPPPVIMRDAVYQGLGKLPHLANKLITQTPHPPVIWPILEPATSQKRARLLCVSFFSRTSCGQARDE